MKKYTLGAIALALAAPAAFAQSSVTLYGVADVGGQYLSGKTKQVNLTSAGQAGSRLGFKGTEDLGDGLYVDFVLEAGYKLDDGSQDQNTAGQTSVLFGRQAFGAIRGAFGTVSAGRQYGSTYNTATDFSEFGPGNFGPGLKTIGGFGGYEPLGNGYPATNSAENNGSPARINNSVRYTTPVFEGLKASVLYAVGEVAGQTGKKNLGDYSLRYTAYGLDAMVAYVDDKGGVGIEHGITTVSAAYTFGPFKVQGGYMGVNDKSKTNADGKGFWVGGDYKVGQNLFRAQWIENKADAYGTVKAVTTNGFGIGYEYDFSKRTDLYTTLSRFQTDGKVSVGRYGNGSNSAVGTAANNDVTEFGLGIKHAF